MIASIPYTYLIGWSKLNRWYYGSRTKKGCYPGDLWVKYFTSSKIVKNFRKEYGEPDVIQIRKIFLDPDDARKYEAKILFRIKAAQSLLWLNRHNGGKNFVCKGFSEITILKFKEKRKCNHWYNNGNVEKFCHICPEGFIKGRLPGVSGQNQKGKPKHTEESKRKISKAFSGEKHPLFGVGHSDEAILKMKKSHKNKKLSEHHKKQISAGMTGKKRGKYTNGKSTG